MLVKNSALRGPLLVKINKNLRVASSYLSRSRELGVAMVLILLGLAGERLYRNKRV